MLATTYYDSETEGSVVFYHDEPEQEQARLEGHPAGIYTGTGELKSHIFIEICKAVAIDGDTQADYHR